MSLASPRSAKQALAISVPSAYIGPDTPEVDVTVTRSSPAGAAALAKRLTVWLSDSYTPVPAGGAGGRTPPERLGVNERVKFQPGQASVTIPVRVPAVPSGSGSVQVVLSVTQGATSFTNWPTTKAFTAFASAEEVPPTIVATVLTPQGLSLTFSKPMDASTVQNIDNYDVVSLPPAPSAPANQAQETVALQSAIYDAATRTVTLIPTKPLDLDSYNVSSSNVGGSAPASSHVLTDVNGTPIDNPIADPLNTNGGYFATTVGRDLWTQ